jgi:hypothetical protein
VVHQLVGSELSEGTVEWNLVLSIVPAVLTPEQEQFLSEFYSLCSRYRQAGIVSYSRGQGLNFYEVMVLIQMANSVDRASAQPITKRCG